MREFAIKVLEDAGIDVKDGYHSRRIDKLSSFLKEYPNARVIVTCQARRLPGLWQYHDHRKIGSYSDGSKVNLIWAAVKYGDLTELNVDAYNHKISKPHAAELFRVNVLRRKELKGLSDDDLLNATGLSESAIKKAESTHNTTIVNAAKIANALDLDLSIMLNKLI